MLYVTYTLNGKKVKATIDTKTYEALLRNSSVAELILYPNEIAMNESFTGKKERRVLNG